MDHEAEASEELVLVEVLDEVVPVEDALSDPTEGPQQAESAYFSLHQFTA